MRLSKWDLKVAPKRLKILVGSLLENWEIEIYYQV